MKHIKAERVDNMGITEKIKGVIKDVSKIKMFPDTKSEEYTKKIESMNDAIVRFKNKLSEEFILGTNMAGLFQECFGPQLTKKGFSATKRWCQGVIKKLKKLDENNAKMLDLKLSDKVLTSQYKANIKAKNLKEFKKIFYTTTAFDSDFLGSESKVKGTYSLRSAVNMVKKELNGLCDQRNFEPKQRS